MGLDNGIEVHYGDYFDEICYWRKCYGLREDIYEILDKYYDANDDTYEYRLTTPILEDILDLFKSYNSSTWRDSIWTWSEIEETIKTDIERVEDLIQLSKDKPEIEIYFYDSY